MVKRAHNENTVYLATGFNPDVDVLLEGGIAAFGIKGAGKSNLVSLLVEQFSRFLIPQIVFDTENEYKTLLPFLPRGVLADRYGVPSAHDVLTKGLQVIVDLSSWEDSQAAAIAIYDLVADLFVVAGGQEPHDRIPCAIHLDEGAYWLPQKAVSYLSKETRKMLLDAFNRLGSRGRKYGLNVFLYTQFVSGIDKDVIRNCAIHVLMRQTQDIDLDRYCDGYLRHLNPADRAALREEISLFPAGTAILHGVPGKPLVRFHEQQSEHVSHTPRVKAAVAKFAGSDIDYANLQLVSYTEQTKKAKTAKPEVKEFYTLVESLAILKISRAQFYILLKLLDIKVDHKEKSSTPYVGLLNYFAARDIDRISEHMKSKVH